MNAIDCLVHLLEDTRNYTLMQVGDLTDEEMMFQPQPHVNHATWLLGHIVGSENGLVLSWCGGQPILPKEYHELFFMGTKPQADPAIYPKKDDILQALAEVHGKAIELVKTLTPEQLDERPKGYEQLNPGAQQLFWCKGACIWHHATHESSHAAQVSMLRRLLGKPYRV